jgi:hypothetical protein
MIVRDFRFAAMRKLCPNLLQRKKKLSCAAAEFAKIAKIFHISLFFLIFSRKHGSHARTACRGWHVSRIHSDVCFNDGSRMKPARFLLSALAATALWLLAAASSALAQDDSLICAAETARQEKQQAIPDRLLHAISLVESGRWDPNHRANLAWPWTVMAEGEGRFLPSKQAAIAEVQKLRARGVRNIDVGCMQINLLAHRQPR